MNPSFILNVIAKIIDKEKDYKTSDTMIDELFICLDKQGYAWWGEKKK